MSSSVDLSENRQPSLYASSTVPFAFALTSVILRFWCRWTKKAGFWYDDWLILTALISAIGLTVDLLWWIPNGLGRHVETFGPNVERDFAIGLFTAELTYTGVIVFVKFSIAALYWRIFKRASIKLPLAILSTSVLMWGIAVFLLTLLQCIPTRGFWDKSIEASCEVDANKFLFAISIPNIAIDLALLVLPIPYVLKLHISRDRKITIMSMFLLGGFVCVASVMRLVAVVTEDTTTDVTWNLVDQGIWAKIESDFAIISACLPTLRPVYLAMRPKRFNPASSNQSTSCALKSNNNSNSKNRCHRKRTFPSWGFPASFHHSRDEDTKPLSHVDRSADKSVDRSSEEERQQSQSRSVKETTGVTTIAIPLGDVPAQHARDARADKNDNNIVTNRLADIMVETGWDVKYFPSVDERKK